MADSSCLHRPLSTTDFVTKATFSSAWTLKNVVFIYIYYKYDLQNPFIDNIILHRSSLRVRNTRRIGRNWFFSSLKVCLVETFIAKQTLTRNWNRLISNEIQYNKVLTSRILSDMMGQTRWFQQTQKFDRIIIEVSSTNYQLNVIPTHSVDGTGVRCVTVLDENNFYFDVSQILDWKKRTTYDLLIFNNN